MAHSLKGAPPVERPCLLLNQMNIMNNRNGITKAIENDLILKPNWMKSLLWFCFDFFASMFNIFNVWSERILTENKCERNDLVCYWKWKNEWNNESDICQLTKNARIYRIFILLRNEWMWKAEICFVNKMTKLAWLL